MPASTLRKLAALLFALVPLLPLTGLYVGVHDCACGMSKDACLCELLAAQRGAHCDGMKGMEGRAQCSMTPVRNPSAAALFASAGLRGWLRPWSGEPGMVLAPAGAVPPPALEIPRSFAQAPEPPPPRIFLSA